MIDFNDKIYNIVKSNPQILDFLIKNGFDKLGNKMLLNSMGKQISLSYALKMRNINEIEFKKNLESYLYGNFNDPNFNPNYNHENPDITVAGVLPCPVKDTLLDKIYEELDALTEKENIKIKLDLKGANLGIDELKKDFLTKEYENLPDIIISAGFEFFFSNYFKEKFMDTKLYGSRQEKINEDFINRGADMKDPQNKFSIISVVPAVFIVNKKVLGDMKMPRSWEDLLDESMEGRLGIPHGDLDLFNAVTLTIYSKYGIDGIKKLRRSQAKSLHPAEMTRSHSNNPIPAVNIAPLFFSTMVKDPSLEVVWPTDGAILSPIIIVNKDNEDAHKIIEILNSDKIATILSLNGNFPSTKIGVDNKIEEGKKFSWVGWEFLNNNDLEKIIRQIEIEFGIISQVTEIGVINTKQKDGNNEEVK